MMQANCASISCFKALSKASLELTVVCIAVSDVCRFHVSGVVGRFLRVFACGVATSLQAGSLGHWRLDEDSFLYRSGMTSRTLM